MPRIKLFVNLMPPRPAQTPSTQSPQKPSNCEVRFAVTASEQWQIGELWKHIKVEHRKAYGPDTRARWVKLQGTEGEDLPKHERVGDMWNVHMDKTDRHVFVVRDMLDRESSLAPDSTLLLPVGTPSVYGLDSEEPRSAKSPSLFHRRIQAFRDTPARARVGEGGRYVESPSGEQEQSTREGNNVDEYDSELQVDEDNFKIPKIPTRLRDAKEAELQLQRESQQSQQSQLSSSPFAPSSNRQPFPVNDVVTRDSQDFPPTPQIPSSSIDFELPESAQRPPQDAPSKTPESHSRRGFILRQPRAIDLINNDPIEDDGSSIVNDFGLDGVTDSDLERAEASTQDTRMTPRSTTDPMQRLVQSARDASKGKRKLTPSDKGTPEFTSKSARIPNRFKTTTEKWTNEEDKKLLQGLRKGWTVERILNEYGLSRSGGSARARKHYLQKIKAGSSMLSDLPSGPSSVHVRQHWTEDEIRKVRKAMCQGWTVVECRTRYFPSRSIESVEHKMRMLEASIFESCNQDKTLPKDDTFIKGWTMREDFKLRRAYREEVNEDLLCKFWFPQVERTSLIFKWRKYLQQMRNESLTDEDIENTQISRTSRLTLPSSPAVIPSSPLKARSGKPQPSAASIQAQGSSRNAQHIDVDLRSSPPADRGLNEEGHEAEQPPEPVHIIRTLQFVRIPVDSPKTRGGFYTCQDNEAASEIVSQPSENISAAANEIDPLPVRSESDQQRESETTSSVTRQSGKAGRRGRLDNDEDIPKLRSYKKGKSRADRHTTKTIEDAESTASQSGENSGRIKAGMPAALQRHLEDDAKSQSSTSSSFESSLSALQRRNNKRLTTKPRPDVFDFNTQIDQSEVEPSEQMPESTAHTNSINVNSFSSQITAELQNNGENRIEPQAPDNNSEHTQEGGEHHILMPNTQHSDGDNCQLTQPHTALMPEAVVFNALYPPNAKQERRSWELSQDEVRDQAREDLINPDNESDLAIAVHDLQDSIALERAAFSGDYELQQAILQKRKQRLREESGKASTRVNEDGMEEIIRYDSDSPHESDISPNGPFGEPSYAAADMGDEEIMQKSLSSPKFSDPEVVEIDDEEMKGPPVVQERSEEMQEIEKNSAFHNASNPPQPEQYGLGPELAPLEPQQQTLPTREKESRAIVNTLMQPGHNIAEGNKPSKQHENQASQQESVPAALAGTGVPRSSARSDSSSQSIRKSQDNQPSLSMQNPMTSLKPNTVARKSKKEAREVLKKRKRESDASLPMPPPSLPASATPTVTKENNMAALTTTSSFSDMSSRGDSKRRRQNKRASLQKRSVEHLKTSSLRQNASTHPVSQTSQLTSFATTSSRSDGNRVINQTPAVRNEVKPVTNGQRPFEAIWQQLERSSNNHTPTPPPLPKSKPLSVAEAFSRLKSGGSSDSNSNSDDESD